jgi:DNA polymerase-3 subunit gamma/tau
MSNPNVTVLALKYRPQTFSELVGQEFLVKTLSNAIKISRIHHAYLLSGARGVGKTTTARIIAKALNCINAPTENPCTFCDNCVDISRGNHPDVFEFDAASNTGIDDVKKLLEGVIYEPIRGKKKIYIIDEVHMLSEKAFNSLLKTLEEPPRNVIFIFATTERNEIPSTILSRCQKFFLKNLSVESLFKHLSNICKSENINFEDEALRLISLKGDGSVRDSLSILDQVIISSSLDSNGIVNITKNDVINTVNIFDQDDGLKILDFVNKNEIESLLKIVDTILQNGFSEIEIINCLMSLIADCIKIKHGLDHNSIIYKNQNLVSISNQNSVPSLLRLWQICLRSLRDFSLPGIQKTKLEIMLLKMCYASSLPTPDDLIERLRDGDINNLLNLEGVKAIDDIR